MNRYMYPNIHSSIIYSYKDRKAAKWSSTDEQIKKIYTYIIIHIYTHTHTYTKLNSIDISSSKKNESLIFATTRMDLKDILKKVRKKKENGVINFMWNPKSKTNECNKICSFFWIYAQEWDCWTIS